MNVRTFCLWEITIHQLQTYLQKATDNMSMRPILPTMYMADVLSAKNFLSVRGHCFRPGLLCPLMLVTVIDQFIPNFAISTSGPKKYYYWHQEALGKRWRLKMSLFCKELLIRTLFCMFNRQLHLDQHNNGCSYHQSCGSKYGMATLVPHNQTWTTLMCNFVPAGGKTFLIGKN